MGDKPNPQPNPHDCPGSPWIDGLQPDRLIVTVSGVSALVELVPPMPPLPNGTYTLIWRYCNRYSSETFPWGISAYYMNNYMHGELLSGFEVGDPPVSEERFLYGVSYPLKNVDSGIMTADNMFFSDGVFTIEQFVTEGAKPASWAPAQLIGIPENGDYLAERGFSGLPANNYRYCARCNKSNLKLKLED